MLLQLIVKLARLFGKLLRLFGEPTFLFLQSPLAFGNRRRDIWLLLAA